jgi:hypothetical protein
MLIDRRPHFAHGWRRGCPLRWDQMYVCPATGLLKIVARKRPESLPTRLHPSNLVIHVLKDETWWELQVRKLPADVEDVWDVWLERLVETLTKAELIRAYGGELYAISKRPLSRTETRQLLRRRRQAAKTSRKRRVFRWQIVPRTDQRSVRSP